MAWDREIVRVGNSLGVRIPSQVFQQTALKEGDTIDVRIEDETTLVLKKEDS